MASPLSGCPRPDPHRFATQAAAKPSQCRVEGALSVPGGGRRPSPLAPPAIEESVGTAVAQLLKSPPAAASSARSSSQHPAQLGGGGAVAAGGAGGGLPPAFAHKLEAIRAVLSACRPCSLHGLC